MSHGVENYELNLNNKITHEQLFICFLISTLYDALLAVSTHLWKI